MSSLTANILATLFAASNMLRVSILLLKLRRFDGIAQNGYIILIKGGQLRNWEANDTTWSVINGSKVGCSDTYLGADQLNYLLLLTGLLCFCLEHLFGQAPMHA